MKPPCGLRPSGADCPHTCSAQEQAAKVGVSRDDFEVVYLSEDMRRIQQIRQVHRVESL